MYVDDLLLGRDCMEEIESVKSFLHSQFSMKDLVELKYFLGIEVAMSGHGIVLNQRKYAMDLSHDRLLFSFS